MMLQRKLAMNDDDRPIGRDDVEASIREVQSILRSELEDLYQRQRRETLMMSTTIEEMQTQSRNTSFFVVGFIFLQFVVAALCVAALVAGR